MDISPLDHDVRVLLTYCNVFSFFGTAPAYVNEKPKKRLTSYVIFVLRICLLTVVSGWEIYYRITKSVYWSKVATTTGFLQSIGEAALVAFTYITTTVRPNRWYSFFEELRGFRSLLNTAGQKHNCTENNTCHTFKVAFFVVFYLLLNTWHLYKDINQDFLTNTTFRFFLLNELLPAVLISRMMVVVKRRYSVLIKLLYVSSRTMVEDEKTTMKNIKLMKFLLKKCFLMVEAFNDIFGWTVFFMSLTTLFTLLSCFLWFFEINSEDSIPFSLEGDDLICVLSFVVLYLAFVVIIVLSCDATEKEGTRFTDLCYTVYIKETNENLKKEFKNLAVISQKVGPNFSAAGFFTINQMFLSTFFSALTSYAIICIQFSTL